MKKIKIGLETAPSNRNARIPSSGRDGRLRRMFIFLEIFHNLRSKCRRRAVINAMTTNDGGDSDTRAFRLHRRCRLQRDILPSYAHVYTRLQLFSVIINFFFFTILDLERIVLSGEKTMFILVSQTRIFLGWLKY